MMFSNRIRVKEWKDHFGVDLIPVLALTVTRTLDLLFNLFKLQLGNSNYLAGGCED